MSGTRQRTREGMLRANARLTRSGQIDYQRSEIGLSGDGMITVNRTAETMSHPQTLAALRGIPITLRHPPEGVTPENYREETVGAIAGDVKYEHPFILGDVFIGDKEALQKLDDGTSELSIGYEFDMDGNNNTVGALHVNHVALVETGRAGSHVRVLDHGVNTTMDSKEIATAVADGLKQALSANNITARDEKGVVVSAVNDALKPVLDRIEQFEKDATEQKKAADAADNKKKAEEAATLLVEETRKSERQRFDVLGKAKGIMEADAFNKLGDSSTKDILVAALGPIVPNAKDQDEGFLLGALTIAAAQAEQGTGTSIAADSTGTDGSNLPPGVLQFDGSKLKAKDERTKAFDNFVETQHKLYTDGGGI